MHLLLLSQLFERKYGWITIKVGKPVETRYIGLNYVFKVSINYKDKPFTFFFKLTPNFLLVVEIIFPRDHYFLGSLRKHLITFKLPTICRKRSQYQFYTFNQPELFDFIQKFFERGQYQLLTTFTKTHSKRSLERKFVPDHLSRPKLNKK